MVERSVAFARAAMDARLIAGDRAARWRGAAIDSRRIAGREIFFALPGERTDGHQFAAAAARRAAGPLPGLRRAAGPGPPRRRCRSVRPE